MRALVLYSGGKDSHYALWCALAQGYDCELVTILSEPDSYLYHYPNVRWVALHASRMHLPHHEVLDTQLLTFIRNASVDCIVTGAIESEYQKERFEMFCEETGTYLFSPLWRKERRLLLREMMELFSFIVVSVSAEGLTEKHLGRVVDRSFIDELSKKGINLTFEGGEAETFVTHSPLFSHPISIVSAHTEWDGVRGTYVIDDAR